MAVGVRCQWMVYNDFQAEVCVALLTPTMQYWGTYYSFAFIHLSLAVMVRDNRRRESTECRHRIQLAATDSSPRSRGLRHLSPLCRRPEHTGPGRAPGAGERAGSCLPLHPSPPSGSVTAVTAPDRPPGFQHSRLRDSDYSCSIDYTVSTFEM